MNSISQRGLIRLAGATVGIGITLVLIVLSLPGAVSSPLPASVIFRVAPVGELEVTPAAPGPVLVASDLRPAAPTTRGGFQMRNQTGSELSIGLRASADSTNLNGLLRVRLIVAGGSLADTTLEGLHRHPAQVTLASGQEAQVRLEAWLPSDVLSGYEGSFVRVSLVPEVSAAGGRS
jgi:hypothetical protein